MAAKKYIHVTLSKGVDDDLIRQFDALQKQYGHGILSAVTRAALRLYFAQQNSLTSGMIPSAAPSPENFAEASHLGSSSPAVSQPKPTERIQPKILDFEEEEPPRRPKTNTRDDGQDDNSIGIIDERL